MEYFQTLKEKEVFLYKCNVCAQMLNAPLPTMDDPVILNLLMYFQVFNYFVLQNDVNRRRINYEE